ncbi:Endoglucanase 13 [Ananas comosus]|uniref:Endoglucanase n=1 Tax=Ananas comosus TaxID=4615 RepID=A0A199VDJ4_ANACO|nr:Endoglucanase 13 [Ananas comosus]
MGRLSISLAFLTVVSVLGSTATAFDYKDALEKSLLFFEAQRSGKLPPDRRVKWRGDSALTDGFEQGVDLVGGYYDAGDHVKFGFPMAFAVTMLSWGVIEFEKETVGDGDGDHLCWERAEDMTTSRTAYKIDTNRRGSEVAGETAAALAAASRAFKPFDAKYSNLLLLHAKQLFTFADTFRGRYDDTLEFACKFYPSSTGFHDELLWAATWLYEATNDQSYLSYVSQNAAAFGGTGWAVKEFYWDNKYAGSQVLLTKVLLQAGSAPYSSVLKQYQAKSRVLRLRVPSEEQRPRRQDDPRWGLLYFDDWNNMQYVSSAAFLLAVYSDYLSASKGNLKCPDGEIQPLDILRFAQSQVDYMLGKNPKSISYLVGYGGRFPTHVHHRGASMPSVSIHPAPIGCVEGFEDWYGNKNADPNVILGALLGGPDDKDGFSDDRKSYKQTEPSLAGNAPLVGVLARLSCLPDSGQ